GREAQRTARGQGDAPGAGELHRRRRGVVVGAPHGRRHRSLPGARPPADGPRPLGEDGPGVRRGAPGHRRRARARRRRTRGAHLRARRRPLRRGRGPPAPGEVLAPRGPGRRDLRGGRRVSRRGL
ncbi:MAG: hypothetical protein AVDCRST_MAG22-1143, partial [uncultured Rubrobacteraceae bacterium]